MLAGQVAATRPGEGGRGGLSAEAEGPGDRLGTRGSACSAKDSAVPAGRKGGGGEVLVGRSAIGCLRPPRGPAGADLRVQHSEGQWGYKRGD